MKDYLELREEYLRIAELNLLAAQLGVFDQRDQCEWIDARGYRYLTCYFFNGDCKCGKTL